MWSLALAALLPLALASTASASDPPPPPARQPKRSAGCISDPAAPQPPLLATPGSGSSKRLRIGDRFVRVALPMRYDAAKAPAPLVVAFHDRDGDVRAFERAALLASPQYNRDAVVVYPEAAVEGRWMSDQNPPPGVDDIKFTGQLLDRIAERLCIDEDRIYVTGLGTGGGMVQLVACDEGLSKRIAAYGLVNANVFQGFHEVAAKDEEEAAKREELDEIWRKCEPKRLPVRMLTIGTENNTVFDYWGKIEVDGRPRVPSVKVLVDWATRDVCGPALDMPKNWRGPDDRMYKTVLATGYIFEGFVEHGSVTKATYHCWGTNPYDVPLAKKSKGPPKAADVDKKPDPAGEMKDDAKSIKEREEQKKAEDLNEFVEKLRESFVLEHYLIRGLDHGWPRVEGITAVPNEGSTANDATGDDVKTVLKSDFQWRHIAGPMRPDVDLDFNLDGAYTFHWGFGDPEPKDRRPRFDTTARLIDFFRMFRLSDDLPSSPRDKDGMTEAETADFGNLVKTLMDVQEKENTKAKRTKTTLEELTAGDEEPVKKILKDEL